MDERCCTSAASPTTEDVPDTKTLNREGLDDVALGERAYDRTRHAEIGE
jgi:hypothetical protein